MRLVIGFLRVGLRPTNVILPDDPLDSAGKVIQDGLEDASAPLRNVLGGIAGHQQVYRIALHGCHAASIDLCIQIRIHADNILIRIIRARSIVQGLRLAAG